MGLEILNQEQDLTTSQFIETARYKHALENELARSISSLRNVNTARVHLALPKASIFVRQRVKPSASVVLAMYAGRALEAGQVAAIVHLVSSSIPEMNASQVTVVDQMGRLLSDGQSQGQLGQSVKQYDYTRLLENDYSDRIVNLLEPLVGFGKVRAQVAAKLDFTTEESASEAFDPNTQVVRSEQLSENDTLSADVGATGIPGALSNRPPAAGSTDEDAADATDAEASSQGNQSRSATRSYEIDKTVSYRRTSTGDIQRLAIAVVIDDKLVTVEPPPPPEGEEPDPEAVATIERQPYNEEELGKFLSLVKEAIGFDDARGDTISLINQSFLEEEIEPLPSPAIWEQAWFQSLLKQVLAAGFVLLLLIHVVRPMVKALLSPAARVLQVGEVGVDGMIDDSAMRAQGQATYMADRDARRRELQFDEQGRVVDPEEDHRRRSFDNNLGYARELIEEDPARAANLLRSWVENGIST